MTPFTIPFIGIGFGVGEGISRYIRNGYISILAFWVHVVLGLIMAYFFYLAMNSKRLSLQITWYALALLIPVYLHFIYNMIVIPR